MEQTTIETVIKEGRRVQFTIELPDEFFDHMDLHEGDAIGYRRVDYGWMLFKLDAD
jgi:hypothetical protein